MNVNKVHTTAAQMFQFAEIHQELMSVFASLDLLLIMMGAEVCITSIIYF